jgi:glycosyltransferase involved in cell wall biosynthesis
MSDPMTPDANAANRPLVSFFITSYFQEDKVRASIEGAFAQTYEPLEILLSDDCSQDGTFAAMQEMAAAYKGPHKIILNQNPENLGIARHVDRVMELTSGALLVQNAGDDISVPERTEKMVAAWLGSGRKFKAIHSARRRLDEESNLHEVFDDDRVLAHMTPLEVIRDHGTLVGASLAWDRELWDVFGPIAPVAIFDDFPTCFRASLIGDIHYIDEPLLNYRTGGISSRADAEHGENYLYGFRIKSHRWHRSFWLRYLEDMKTIQPPDYAECKRLCEEKVADAEFHIALAETSWWKLPLVLPGNLARSFGARDAKYLRENLKYLMGPFYKTRLDRKMQRR